MKIRGNRIERAEIEGVLRSLDNVKEAAVLARADTSGHQRLIAYVAPVQEPVPTLASMRAAISGRLPDYMMPSAFMVLDTLPYLPNGKIDLKSLPVPDGARPDLSTQLVPPRTPIEARLATIWSDILGVEEVGVHDNFLELGGHSLLATRIVSSVIDAFKVEVPLRAMFDSPTVADMALLITQYQAQDANQEKIEKLLIWLESLSDGQAQNVASNPTSREPGFD